MCRPGDPTPIRTTHKVKLPCKERQIYYQGQPKAGTGHKMLFVLFVFSKSRFHGPVFRCDKIVVVVILLEAIEGIPDKAGF